MTYNRFRGLYRRSVDMKGRVAIPNEFRRALPPETNGQLYLSKGRDKTIEVHPLLEWERFENEILLKLSKFHPDPLRLRRNLAASVIMVKLDAQGRILIPNHFKAYAEIETEVIFNGVVNYFEIWNPNNYENYQKKADEHFLSDLENIVKYLDLSKNLNIDLQ
ncbi:MAG: division/cell wall cluster transcriptional repressor MraZ [candidate division WOR-3 bacterium]